MTLPEVSTLLKLAKQANADSGPSLRAALLADTASQLLSGSLRGMMWHRGQRLELFEAEFEQIEMQVMDPTSALYRHKPETVLIYLSAERIACNYGTLTVAERARFAEDFIDRVQRLHQSLAARRLQSVFFNLADPGDGVFGHYGNKVGWSLRSQLKICNAELARLAQQLTDFAVFDLASVQAAVGRASMFDPKLYFTSKFAIAPAVLPTVARDLCQMLVAGKGTAVKCLIVDLDNTLWGGVIGDDGLDHIQIGELGLGRAFSAFQSWLKQLKDRGIVIAVCSKNADAVAREPFTEHPDMILRLEDIAVFMANWNDKASNIRAIKSIIDVDYSAMMFLDDNPAERQLVRESFPTMRVPDLPDDPSEYVVALQALNPFETGSYTAEDGLRTTDYQSEANRRSERENYVDLNDFLRSLRMKGAVRAFQPFNIPRIAQLTQRSNQFNLRTVRYTEQQLADIAVSDAHMPLAFELKDRFGDSGLIGVVILQKRAADLFIDTWLMSCRVLGRGMEQFIINAIMRAARSGGYRRVIGEYLPTAKNAMVKDHYRSLGFSGDGGRWIRDVDQFEEFPVEIALEGSETSDALAI
jgi:FkbH-like protein